MRPHIKFQMEDGAVSLYVSNKYSWGEDRPTARTSVDLILEPFVVREFLDFLYKEGIIKEGAVMAEGLSADEPIGTFHASN